MSVKSIFGRFAAILAVAAPLAMLVALLSDSTTLIVNVQSLYEKLFSGAVSSRVQSLFEKEMLNVRLSFLETVIGPARHSYQTRDGVEVREYIVDRCQVTARVKDGNVRAYGLRLTDACNADLSKLFAKRLVVTPSTTIGSLADALGGGPGEEFQISCLRDCGNAADPTASYRWLGPRVFGFIEVEGTAVIADDKTVQISSQWDDELTRREGENYVIDGRFNCDPRYRQAGLKLFRQAPLSQIVVGFDVVEDTRTCRK